MPHPYLIDIKGGILYIQFFRKPSISEIINVMDHASALGKIRLRLWFFPDDCWFTVDELIMITDHGKKTWSLPSRAAVVGSKKFDENLARMQKVNPEKNDFKTRVFTSEEDAVYWLRYGS